MQKNLMQVTLTSNFYYFSSNQRAISRLADSSESDPCTTFWIAWFSLAAFAKSPRIVPGKASYGRVAPIIVRQVSITLGPEMIPTRTGSEVINSRIGG